MKIPKIFLPEKNLEGKTGKLLKETVKVQPRYTQFEIIDAFNYAEGIAKLKEQGKKPFTFYENVEAGIADYEANGENAKLFKTWLDSVTGIAYKARSTKFKLIYRSDKLENIKPDFDQSFIPIDYDAEQGIELDSKKGKYNQCLTKKEAKNHEFWFAAMNGNKGKLAEYVDIWFDKTKVEKGMGIYLRSNTSQDVLWALFLGSDYYYYSHACGDSDLGNYAHFVSGA